jgi:hypothetical protein
MALRHFTIEEANALIPRLEMPMERLQRTALTARSAVHEAEAEPAVRTTVDVLRVRPVLLCWQYGERSIGFWHAIDEGFAGRRVFPVASTPPLQ